MNAGAIHAYFVDLCTPCTRKSRHQVTMKRSRTCHCLVELDDTPKRTRSTSNLDSLQRWLVGAQEKNQVQKQQNCENQPSFLENRQKFDLASAVRLLQWSSIPEEGGMAMASSHPSAQSRTATSPTLDGGGSKARSKSLNEITILGHEQLIAHNDDDLRYFVGTEQRLRFSSDSTSSRDDSPYEGDTGDSSDYFYGVASSDEADDEISLIPIGSGGDTSPRKIAGIIGRYATPSTVDTDSTDNVPDIQSLDIGGETCSNEEIVAVSCDGGDPLAPTPATASAPSPTLTWVKLGDSEHGTTHGREEDSEKRTSCPKLSQMVSSFQAGATGTAPEREKRQQLLATVSPPWPGGSLATLSPLGDAASSDETGLVSSAACGMSRLKLADSKPKLSPVVELGLDQIWNSWDAGQVYSDKPLERSFYPRAGKA